MNAYNTSTWVWFVPLNWVWMLLCLKSKPHNALQSLVVTACGKPCVRFIGCTPRGEATWCLPLAWRLTELMFGPGCHFDLTLPCIDKTVSCVVIDSCPESEDKLFLPAAVTVSLKFTQQSKERTEDSFKSTSSQFCLTFQATFSPVCADCSAGWAVPCAFLLLI